MATPALLTASANVKTGMGRVYGVVVATTSSGTYQLFDSDTTTTSQPLTGVITPAAGTYLDFFGMTFSKGLYVVTANTISCTVIFD